MQTKAKKFVFKRLLLDLFNKPFLLVFLIFISLIQVALSVYLPVLIGKAVDASLSTARLESLKSILFQVLVIITLNTGIQWLTPILYNNLLYQFSQQIKDRVIKKLHQMPLAYIDRQSIGDMVSRVTTDSEQLTNGLQMVFSQFTIGFLTISFTIVAMARIDWLMLGIVLLLTPSSLLLARFIAKRSFHYYQAQAKSRGKLSQFAEEALRQEKVIHIFNAQKAVVTQYHSLNKTYADYSQQAIFYASIVNPTTRFINSLIYALLAGLGAIRIMTGSFTVGQLTTFLSCVVQYTKPFNDMSSVFAEMESSLACAQRLYAILDEKVPVKEEGREQLGHIKGQIDFKSVSFSYDKTKPLIQNVSFSVSEGDRVAIVGPTGAGKSTLVNLLMRFYDLDSGQITLDGKAIDSYSLEEYRQVTAMVLQDTWLKDGTIHDMIAYGSQHASRLEVVQAAKAARAHFFIDQLPDGYNTYLNAATESLSQGQAQLIAIARVFLKKPKVLILDEATSSIDSLTEKQIQEAFEELMRGRTSFIIAHRLKTIEKADFILVMDKGQLVEWGTHQELMSAQRFYYRLQKSH
ncbi:ABC transporter ATP-binding protein [Streptococcus ictaluri]|uniref:ABC transporter transmembrane region n=1 Tax=Streptococcus ictaluri 707-05 TaxID=764299 RepID=G5K3C8_9STRE|nr:ABC transporter ATP-binding protein [Streptococcus ictaluri]EHI69595.1 ABC transporter transmembrane region [Streptococcus ictaluri 707-05]